MSFPSDRGLPWALVSSVLLVQVALGIVLFAIFMQYVPDDLGASDAYPGLLLASYGAARFVVETPAGTVSDHIGRRASLLLGYALMLPALLLMLIVRNADAYLVFAALLGMATAFLWPATYALAADLYEPGRRGRVIGLLNFGQLLGFGAGALIGALMVETLPGVLLGVALLAVAAAFVTALVGLPVISANPRTHPTHEPRLLALPSVMSWRLASLGTLILASGIGIGMLIPLLAPYGEDELGISFRHLTFALSPALVVGAVCYIPAGAFADRFGRMPPFFVGQVLLAVGCLAVAAVSTWQIAMFLAIPIFLGNVVTVPAWNAAIMDLAPVPHRGTVIGFTVALSGLALAVGPAIGGLVVNAWDSPAAFRLSAAISSATAVGIIAYALTYPEPRSTSATQPPPGQRQHP